MKKLLIALMGVLLFCAFCLPASAGNCKDKDCEKEKGTVETATVVGPYYYVVDTGPWLVRSSWYFGKWRARRWRAVRGIPNPPLYYWVEPSVPK